MLHLYFYPIADSYALLAVAAALLLAGLLVLGPARGRLTRPQRGVLLALRAAVIAAIILAMLRPTLVYLEIKKHSAMLAILVDRSRSMTVHDETGGKSRWEAMRRALDNAAPALAKLADRFELKVYTFDGQTHAVQVEGGKIVLDDTPDGQQTAIGAAIDDVRQQAGSKRLLGLIVLSDGAQRALRPRQLPPQDAAARLRQLGYPLYAVPFGQSRGLGQAKDIAVKDLLANQTVYVKNELAVSGQIRVDGFVNRDIVVRLLFETAPGKMEEVDRTTVRATADGQLLPVKFSYAPQEEGERKITLEAVREEGELVATNNEMSTFVNVLKGGLNVLYLEGDMRVEQVFLRRALDASPDIKVDFVRIDPRRPETRPGDLADRFKPGKYDVYLIGDLDATAFRGAELQDLAEAVNRGAGLMMLGGFHTFGAGGYFATPLDKLLPVVMEPLERQRPDDATLRTDLHLPAPARLRPTPELGLLHFALILAGTRKDNEAQWKKLPPLDDPYRFRGVKEGAFVLADDGQGAPLLVQSGTNRVLAFAGYSTWRWSMRGFGPLHKRFWRQVVLWLAGRDEAPEGNVWVKLEKRRFAPGEPVVFTAGANGPSGEPLKDADYELQLVGRDGRRQPLPYDVKGSQIGGTFRETQEAGDYAIEVKVTHQKEFVGTTRARFLVYAQDLELDNAAADVNLLESIAARTGGAPVAPEQLSDLVERLLKKSADLDVPQETKKTLWDTWWMFLVVVVLLSVEWFLRKRWGLV
jgi:hypothetical protein